MPRKAMEGHVAAHNEREEEPKAQEEWPARWEKHVIIVGSIIMAYFWA